MIDSAMKDTEALKKKQCIVAQMYEEREKWVPKWKLLSKFIYPMRGRFDEDQYAEGQRRDGYLIDPYPMTALLRCAAGLHSGLTSPSRPWFELGLADKEKAEMHEVRLWLNKCRDIMMRMYEQSNLYKALFEMEAEIAQFGTAGCLMLEDDNVGIRFRPYTCGEYAGAVDSMNRVIKFARRFEMNAEQLVLEFGEDNVSPMAKTCYEKHDIKSRFKVEMLIEKNNEYDPDVIALGNFPWKATYWEQGTSQGFLRISGYNAQPFMMPRWSTVANEPYGFGPGENALGDCMQLQVLQKSLLGIVENEARPAMVFPSSMKNVDRLPGGINFVPDGTQMTAYPLIPAGQKRYDGLANVIMNVQNQIDKTFYNDIMAMLARQENNTYMTAREVAERHEEKLLLLGPVIEQFHNEVLDVLTERVFDYCLRHELFPPAPQIIQSRSEMKVHFVSLLAQAQQSVELPSLQNALAFVQAMSQTHPEAVDLFNVDRMVRKMGTLGGVPEEIFNSEDEVNAIRQQRAEQQAQQAQMAQAAAMAKPAKDFAEAGKVAAGMAEDNAFYGGML